MNDSIDKLHRAIWGYIDCWTEKEQEVPPERLSGGLYPDYYYRKSGTDDCEWIVELKLWSVNGKNGLEAEVNGALKGLKADAVKWSRKKTHPFILLAVNIPGHFKRAPRSRQTYEPGEFADRLINEVKDSSEFRKLNGHGDGVVVIKRIGGGTAQLVECIATSKFAESCSRPADIKVLTLE